MTTLTILNLGLIGFQAFDIGSQIPVTELLNNHSAWIEIEGDK